MTRSIWKYTTLPSHNTVKCREVPLPLTTLIYIPNPLCSGCVSPVLGQRLLHPRGGSGPPGDAPLHDQLRGAVLLTTL